MIRRLSKKVYRLFHPIQGEIWCLHRVVEKRSEYQSNRELEITPAYLEELVLKYKSEGFSFVSIHSLIQSRAVFPKKHVNISFDDGFRDVYQFAYPIFKKHQIPFTLYLTTDFPEGKADIWWIQMEQSQTIASFEKMMKQIYGNPEPMADTMHGLTGTQPDPGLCRSLSLSWDEIQEMVDSGLCTVGSHTVSHPGLTRIGTEACLQELGESKRIIKEKLGIDAIHLSYPHSMENELVREMASRVGYVSATLGYGGSIRKGDDAFCLHRKFIVQE